MKAGQGFGNFGDLSPPQGSNGTQIYSLTELNTQRSAEEENTRLLNTRKDFIYSFQIKRLHKGPIYRPCKRNKITLLPMWD